MDTEIELSPKRHDEVARDRRVSWLDVACAWLVVGFVALVGFLL